jgi:hypothetical protein
VGDRLSVALYRLKSRGDLLQNLQITTQEAVKLAKPLDLILVLLDDQLDLVALQTEDGSIIILSRLTDPKRR